MNTSKVFGKQPVSGFYHICSDGNFASAIFLDDDDFRAGTNRIAVCKLKTGVKVIGYVLMDNHFHFEVQSNDYSRVVRFALEYKRLTAMYNASKYGPGTVDGAIMIQIIPVTDADYAKTLLCYILKNPTKARMAMFYDYKWSSASCYFVRNAKAGAVKRAGSLTKRELRRIVHSHIDIPDDWLVEDGVILPSNYIPEKDVEDMFGGPKPFMFFLSQYKEEEIDRDMGDWHEINLPDTELRAVRKVLSVKMFGTERIRELSAPRRLKLAKALRRLYLCPKKQLARVVGLPLREIEREI